MSVEDRFFPLIAGELGSSLQNVERIQKKLEGFYPTVKVMHVQGACYFSFVVRAVAPLVPCRQSTG